jgi:competence protein ComEC
MMRTGKSWAVMAALLGVVAFAGCAERDASVLVPDTTAPVVSGVAESQGRVTWDTDEDATCVLLYGTSTGDYDHYGYNVYDGGRSHRTDLIDVSLRKYYFRVMATDGAGNVTTSPETTFTLTVVPDPDKLVYTMVNVGWGDCHFLEFPNGTNVMIDAGSYEHYADVSSFLNRKGIPTPDGIDYMIGTHAHADHYGGFRSGLLVLYNKTTFLAPESPSVSVWPFVDDWLVPWQIPTHGLVAGQTDQNADFLNWDEEHGVRVRVLAAGAGRLFTSGDNGDSVNCDSAVLKVSFGMVDLLLTADAEEFTEDLMIKDSSADLACEVLKVGHHGNDDATSEPFLERVRPRVGLISNSLAENDGVFKQSVINLLREYGVDYYVTDRTYMNAARNAEPKYGHVTVTTDGETYVVGSWR